MAFALVAHISAQYTGFGGGATTSNIDTTGSKLLVVSASGFQSTAAVGILSDSNSNTWIQLTVRPASGGASAFQGLWYCINPTVGSGHNFTITDGNYGTLEVSAFSNPGTVSFDSSVGANGNSSTAQPSSITPANADSLLCVGLAYQNTGPTLTGIDSSFTITDTESGLGVIQGSLAYKIQSGAGSAENPSWSFSSSLEWVSSIAVFFAGTAGPTEIDITKSDSFSFSDSVVVEIPIPSIVQSDTLALSDSLAATFGLILGESFTLGDLLNYGLSLPINIDGDQFSFSDAIVFLIGIGLAENDNFSFSDLLKIAASVSRQLGDNILLSDFLAALVTNLPSYSDSFALSDSTVLCLGLALKGGDSLSLSDSVIVTLSNNLLLAESDTLSLSDSLEYSLSSSLDQYIRHYLNDVPR